MMPGFIALFAVQAEAVLTSQIIRVGYRVMLDDAGLVHGDDFFTDRSGVHVARWAEVWACEWPCNAAAPWFAPTFTDGNGEATFLLDTTRGYSIILVAHTDWSLSGRHVYVSDLSNVYWAKSMTQITPTVGPDVFDVIFSASTPGQDWVNSLAIASWVIRRRPYAFPTFADNGAIYKIKHTGTTVYGAEVMTVNLAPAERRRKYTIAHEFGHLLLHTANWPGPPAVPLDWKVSYDYDVSDAVGSACDDFEPANHYYTSKEYSSAAFNEGFGHFVAAMAFNNTTQSDCRFVPSDVFDWDPLDPNNQTSAAAFSCEGAPLDLGGAEWSTAGVPGGDYFGNYCLENPGSISFNRSTEFDWARFLWDAMSKSSMLFSDVVDTLVAAEPHNWTPGAFGQLQDYPRVRIQDAFTTSGWQSVWDAHAAPNGVHY